MRKYLYLCLFILIGCKSKNDIVSIESRKLVVFDFEEMVRENQIELTRVESDSLIKYRYENLVDSTKSMSFQYLKHQDKIYFGPEQFYLKEKKYLVEESVFDKYETEPIPDGMGPLLFNKEYGVLAFDNGWGMQFHFVTKKNEKKFQLPIIYDFSHIDDNEFLKFKLHNQSEFELKNITIGLPDTVLTYDYLGTRAQTEWTNVKSAFHYGFVRFFDVKDRKYFIQPIDYMGEKAFEKGELTYVIKNIDSINQAFELDFDYKN
ncbi:hypothetical protein K1F50_04615 [Muricauda oceani]|uniref:Lipoprotein n=1 Tax=Flagellimonas oceani TaxID=2698672 RepID=A0A6G7J8L9_9FLAO|nr:hypothetical protein [Allomuricauda oceani]MBW8242071.1 hypothetical protein [Allomuricauda oceani]QII46979.1 hypothetical protein GVT53_20600 [Allomuricauda oceani]